jgi:hypothetical protein
MIAAVPRLSERMSPFSPNGGRKDPPPRSRDQPGPRPRTKTLLDRQERKGEWKNPKHALQWRSTLMVLPQWFRDLSTDQTDRKAVHAVFEPIWDVKVETARRLRGRIAKVSTTRAVLTTTAAILRLEKAGLRTG